MADITPDQMQAAAPIVRRWAWRYQRRGAGLGLGVEDLEQLAWIGLIRVHDDYDESRGRWVGWVAVVASRELHTVTKARAPVWVEIPPDLPAPAPDPARADDGAVRDLLGGSGLSPRERAVVEAVDLEGRTLEETAARLGISTATTWSARSTALQKLRRVAKMKNFQP